MSISESISVSIYIPTSISAAIPGAIHEEDLMSFRSYAASPSPTLMLANPGNHHLYAHIIPPGRHTYTDQVMAEALAPRAWIHRRNFNQGHNKIPISNPMPIFDMALLSLLLTAAHIMIVLGMIVVIAFGT